MKRRPQTGRPPRKKVKRRTKGGVLAVWGSPGSGKSVIAAKIACALARQKKNVILLLCDQTAPMLPVLCSSKDLIRGKSLGTLFSAPEINEGLVRKTLTAHKTLPHLAILGMKKGENEFTHAPCTRECAQQLLTTLRRLSPYVVVDCTSYLAHDLLSTVAITESNGVLALSTCELKSLAFFHSQSVLLRELLMEEDTCFKALSDIRPNQDEEGAAQALGGVPCRLHHMKELEEQVLAGEVFSPLKGKQSKTFGRELSVVVEEVFGL